jgi:hemolysin activation/secretion protein
LQIQRDQLVGQGRRGPHRVGLRARACLALAVATLAFPISARAQAPQPQNTAPPGVTAPELSPEARLPRPPPRRSGDIFAPEPPGPCPLTGSDVQVTVGSVTFRGATALTTDELRPAYAEYLGRPQPVAVLCAIRDRAARLLFDRGVLARVEIPEQRITGGALVLDVVEAHIVNVRVRGDIGPTQAAVERYVEKLRGMAPFDMRKAQRYLLLASDVPGVRVRAAVRPSTSGERGAVDIDVTVARDGVDAIASVQNLGSKAVGRWGGLLRGEVDALTPFGEATSLTVFRTLEANEQWLVQATQAARFGGEGLVGRLSGVYGESNPGGALKALDLMSRSVVANAELAYPLVRLRARNLNLSGGFDWIDQETDLAGLKLNRDRLRVLYLRADGDARTEALARPVLLTAGVSVRKGLAGLGASDKSDVFLTRGFANPQAWLVRGAATAETVLGERLSAGARLQGQYSASALLPFEQLSLGTLSVGRGYDPAAVLGDSGVGGAFDVRYGPLALHPALAAAPYAFFDAGWVRNNRAGLSGLERSRTLTSVGAGVVFRVAGRANVDLTYAHPLDAAAPGAARAGDRILVQLTASLK